jgi:hypothetical protein
MKKNPSHKMLFAMVCCMFVGSIEGQDSAFDINDPRNPECPCHEHQRLADEEYLAGSKGSQEDNKPLVFQINNSPEVIDTIAQQTELHSRSEAHATMVGEKTISGKSSDKLQNGKMRYRFRRHQIQSGKRPPQGKKNSHQKNKTLKRKSVQMVACFSWK